MLEHRAGLTRRGPEENPVIRLVIPFPQLIPYGADRWAPDAIRLIRIGDGRAELEADGLVAVAPAGTGGVVRLNACGLDLPAAGPGEDDDPARRLAARLVRLAGPWNSWATRFIDGWFARLALEIERDRPLLEARLAPFEGLYRPEDFIFSGPAPLPRAFLLAPPAEGTTPDATTERVQVDIGFFIAGRPVAVLASPSPLTPAATRRRAERLAAAGIDVVTASAAAIAGPDADVFTALLARLGGRFHDGEPLPSAPGAPVIGLF